MSLSHQIQTSFSNPTDARLNHFPQSLFPARPPVSTRKQAKERTQPRRDTGRVTTQSTLQFSRQLGNQDAKFQTSPSRSLCCLNVTLSSVARDKAVIPASCPHNKKVPSGVGVGGLQLQPRADARAVSLSLLGLPSCPTSSVHRASQRRPHCHSHT